MAEINIPMNLWSKDKLQNKTKLATTRNKRYGKIGDTFIVDFDKISYKYEILGVFKLPLYYVAKDLYHIEGAENPLEFRKIWEEIHPDAGWNPDKEVYVHLIRLIEVLSTKK